MSKQKISVLMPTFNAADYVEDAVKSILDQTYSDFEFLIIDDASSDETWSILSKIAATDGRIRLFRNKSTKGLPESINCLLPFASGDYIARMDSDDIALPDRFSQQVKVLDSGEADLCGGAFIPFPSPHPSIRNGPLEDSEIKVCLLFESTIRHPTVMMRRELLEREQFRTESIPVADYDLWVRLAKFAKFRNLPEVLIFWRLHPKQVTARSESENLAASMRVRKMALASVGIHPTERELYLHSLIWTPTKPETWQDLLDTEQWLLKLLSHLKAMPAAAAHLSKRWYKTCLKSAPYGLKVHKLFRRSKLYDQGIYKNGENAILLIACLLRLRYHSDMFMTIHSLRPSMRKQAREISRLMNGFC